jgi:hypothetical protein
MNRDHVELPKDFHQRAEEIKLRHRATPVLEERRG